MAPAAVEIAAAVVALSTFSIEVRVVCNAAL